MVAECSPSDPCAEAADEFTVSDRAPDLVLRIGAGEWGPSGPEPARAVPLRCGGRLNGRLRSGRRS